MSHTPGPWVVDTTVALGAYGVWTDYSTKPETIPGAGGPATQICSVKVMGDMPREERDANARLIAAAPDLLKACEAALGIPGLFANAPVAYLAMRNAYEKARSAPCTP